MTVGWVLHKAFISVSSTVGCRMASRCSQSGATWISLSIIHSESVWDLLSV